MRIQWLRVLLTLAITVGIPSLWYWLATLVQSTCVKPVTIIEAMVLVLILLLSSLVVCVAIAAIIAAAWRLSGVVSQSIQQYKFSITRRS